MRLKSLEVHGFKTFPDKTKLSFESGITSVVGPNGSGKSNISDAIRWVLGEQSPKSLRCSRMEDVVFNGTDKRKKTGYAEVTLNIDNSDRVLDFNGDEIAVTRRYYRSGESEYLINKAAVRLRDINELFMDTGLACYLSFWNDPRVLENSAMAGAMFETYVVSEIIKQYSNKGIDVRSRLAYYRDNNGREIDLMIIENGTIYPIEIKKSADPGKDALKNFSVLDKLPDHTGEGVVICLSTMPYPLDSKNKIIPIGMV